MNTNGTCHICAARITYLEGVGGCPRCDWGTLPETPGAAIYVNDPNHEGKTLRFWPYPEHGSFYCLDPRWGGALFFAPMLESGEICTDPDTWGEVAWGMVDEETEAECARIRDELRAKGDA